MVLFEYDDEKSKTNMEKYGIDFETAQKLWNDPDLLEIKAKSETSQGRSRRHSPCHRGRVTAWTSRSMRSGSLAAIPHKAGKERTFHRLPFAEFLDGGKPFSLQFLPLPEIPENRAGVELDQPILLNAAEILVGGAVHQYSGEAGSGV
jgi:uncharacterized DUF497 family protein